MVIIAFFLIKIFSVKLQFPQPFYLEEGEEEEEAAEEDEEEEQTAKQLAEAEIIAGISSRISIM